mgnify:CR=1 FL=1
MINLSVKFRFQTLNVEALFDFKLTVRGSIINNFEAKYTTIILTIFRGTKMFENVRIFIWEKMLIYTCLEIPVVSPTSD